MLLAILRPRQNVSLNEKMRKDPVVSEVYLAKSEELGPGTFSSLPNSSSMTSIVNRFLDKDNNREAFREFKRSWKTRQNRVTL